MTSVSFLGGHNPAKKGSINPLYTGGLYHRYMLDESIFHLRGIKSILSFYSIFGGKSC